MMLKLLLYVYSTGVTSSQEMKRRCHVDVAARCGYASLIWPHLGPFDGLKWTTPERPIPTFGSDARAAFLRTGVVSASIDRP